jgi:endonuclease YncB( thermonuclease family)
MPPSARVLPTLRCITASVLTVSVGLAAAETLRGEVVGLADGDTVTVLDDANIQHKVRIAGIDAPERKQPFGNSSRHNLATLVYRRHVVVEWKKTDRYGRLVGRVTVGQLDTGLEQVRIGMAWHYKAYEREQTPEDRRAYAAAEDSAREHRIGLWSQPNQTPPWDFRRGAEGAGPANLLVGMTTATDAAATREKPEKRPSTLAAKAASSSGWSTVDFRQAPDLGAPAR